MTASSAEIPIDMAAVGRVARRVGLQNIVLISMQAARFPSPGARGTLEPDVSQDHRLVGRGPKALEVESKFVFSVKQAEAKILEALFVYRLFYAVQGAEPVDENDAKVFARANGAYHSWPFVREMLYGMTSKMGLPPFLLPVLTFQPPPPSRAKPLDDGGVAVQRRLRRRRARVGK